MRLASRCRRRLILPVGMLTVIGTWLIGARAVVAAPCGALLCLRAAIGARGGCAAQAHDDFTVAKSLCADRDPICVSACASHHESCRTGVGLVPGLEACDDALRIARAECDVRHAGEPLRRALCLDRADLVHARCRARVRRETLRRVRRCNREIVVCITACGPGSPPGGSVPCRVEAARGLKAALAACGAEAAARRNACLAADQGCVEDCRAAYDTCTAPARTDSAAARAACDADELAGVAACGGDPACVPSAEANGFACREAARADAAPALRACAAAHRQCRRGCSGSADVDRLHALASEAGCTLAGDGASR
jgi:hypothetical protein